MKNILSKLFIIVSILTISANIPAKTNYAHMSTCITAVESQIMEFLNPKNKESLTHHMNALFSTLDKTGKVLANNKLTRDFHRALKTFGKEIEKLKGTSAIQAKFKIQKPFSLLEQSYKNVITKINKQCSTIEKSSDEYKDLQNLKIRVTQLITRVNNRSERLGMWGRASLWKLRNKR